MKFITNAILENTEIIKKDIFHLNEIDKLYEDTLKGMDLELKIPKDVMASFNVKDVLNPEIWDDKTLKPEVKNKLIRLGKDFFKDLELPKEIKLKDILFLGSLANFNYSSYSDIDLHIVVDFSLLPEDPEQAKKRFDAQKNLWNLKHDINIKGFPVEVYVQDVKEKVHASAIYSVPFDKWVLEPKKENAKIDKALIKRKVEKIFNKLRDIQKDYESEDYNKVINKTTKLKDLIKNMRQAGLEDGGEYSTENLVFKVLRRTSFMEILDTLKIKAYDKLVSVEEQISEDHGKIVKQDYSQEFKQTGSGKAIMGKQNIAHANEAQLNKAKIRILQSINIGKDYRDAFENGTPDENGFIHFNAIYQGERYNCKIPPQFKSNETAGGEKVDYRYYFNIPEIGDGAMQIALDKDGRMLTQVVRSKSNMTNPNLSSAADAGYEKEYEGRTKYFNVKVGVKGKFHSETPRYSIFPSPSMDAIIKTNIAFRTEILDFMIGGGDYTSDEKGKEISNNMELYKKIEKIRKDAEDLIGTKISKDEDWQRFKQTLYQRQPLDVTQAVNDFVRLYKTKHPNRQGKKDLSMSDKEREEWEAQQKEKIARIAAAKARIKR